MPLSYLSSKYQQIILGHRNIQRTLTTQSWSLAFLIRDTNLVVEHDDGDLDVLTCEENFGDNSEGLGVIWYENPL